MENDYSIYPARIEWPAALNDAMEAPADTGSIRLISGAKNIARLHAYKNLKALWCFSIDETRLAEICECASLESLFIENIKTKNLDCLKKLGKLRTLGLEGCSKITSLTALSDLQSLTGLALTHFKNVHDLAPLSNLGGLRALAVDGSMWTKMQVETFKPLEELKNLEYLSLANIKAENESLRPLAALQKLKQLDIANFYPMQEFAWLSQQLKTTKCTWFQPYIEIKHMVCDKCNNLTMVMLTGKRKPTVCSQCARKLLENQTLEWEKAAENSA